MGILTHLDDTYIFTIYLNYPYIFIHIIPAFFQEVNHKPVIEHERDYYFCPETCFCFQWHEG